ncbi:MAG: glycosyltransferase family 1 protein [Chitinophagaceae bacterium]
MLEKIMDLVCFSHLRWNFVFQRPQHLLTRFSVASRVFYIEEPIFTDDSNYCQITNSQRNIFVVVPYLKKGMTEKENFSATEEMLSVLFSEHKIEDYIFWYYSPLFLAISTNFQPTLIVYDCMDELSAFKFAPKELKERENDLLTKADLVFTGGHSLFEAKKHLHSSIYPFPSSIDKEHFLKARTISNDPVDQKDIPHPRIGFYGVLDERMDLELIGSVAAAKPEWQFVLIGPTVKIDPATLPRLTNIHYLGSKSYQELPSYLAGWDISIIPFSLNESTRYISPTKTPEYLSAGKPVISSSIQDVVKTYGVNDLVQIADSPEDFIKAAESALNVSDRSSWLLKVDEFLEHISWDKTWNQMMELINDKLAGKVEEKKTYNLNLKETIYV